MMSARVIWLAGRASRWPPSVPPRWLSTRPALRSWVKMFCRYLGGICWALAICSALTRPGWAAASSAAAWMAYSTLAGTRMRGLWPTAAGGGSRHAWSLARPMVIGRRSPRLPHLTETPPCLSVAFSTQPVVKVPMHGRSDEGSHEVRRRVAGRRDAAGRRLRRWVGRLGRQQADAGRLLDPAGGL